MSIHHFLIKASPVGANIPLSCTGRDLFKHVFYNYSNACPVGVLSSTP
ncbi:hypothetical protein HMPREF0290_1257 [Corynebacterium efficiens YS-314]|nr:hypothetical protein HMPREF0290_1257 [Corynebacterium efficiens YS-314]